MAAQPQWQSMDTAPADGTKILAVTDEGMTVIYWSQHPFLGGWELAVNSSNAQDSGFTQARKWMPLPPPPKD